MFDVLVAHVPVASNGGHKEHETDVVFRTPDIVGSLAINPVGFLAAGRPD